MKNRLVRILLGVAIGFGVLAGGTWVLIQTLGEREPRFEGELRYYWAEQIKSQNPAVSNQANLILNQEIIPHLTKTLLQDTNDSSLRVMLVDRLNTLPGVYIFFRIAEARRADAAMGFGEFGPAAKGAAPTLLRALQGQDLAVRARAAISLGRIQANPDVVIPLLISYLDNDDLREAAVEALGEYGDHAKVVIPKLLPLLEIRDKDLHHDLEEALKKIDPEAAVKAGVNIESQAQTTSKKRDR